MRKRRFSGNDRHLWPFTLSRHGGSWCPLGIMLDSGGGGDDGPTGCHIRFSACGFSLICELPPLVPTFRIRHYPTSWDAATVERLGRNWYDEVFPREYGFHFSNGSLHVHNGPQTHDSATSKSRCYFVPWRSWRFVRTSFYDLRGNHFWTERDGERAAYEARAAVEEVCPKACFDMEDYDGEPRIATTHIEEREWRFGTMWCSWMSLFVPRKLRRSLDISFSAEVGPEKGSWKGGTVGTSIDMLPGELHEAAFRRYCDQEHRSKYRRFRVRFVGVRVATP